MKNWQNDLLTEILTGGVSVSPNITYAAIVTVTTYRTRHTRKQYSLWQNISFKFNTMHAHTRTHAHTLHLYWPEGGHDAGGEVFVGPGDKEVTECWYNEYSVHQCREGLRSGVGEWEWVGCMSYRWYNVLQHWIQVKRHETTSCTGSRSVGMHRQCQNLSFNKINICV